MPCKELFSAFRLEALQLRTSWQVFGHFPWLYEQLQEQFISHRKGMSPFPNTHCCLLLCPAPFQKLQAGSVQLVVTCRGPLCAPLVLGCGEVLGPGTCCALLTTCPRSAWCEVTKQPWLLCSSWPALKDNLCVCVWWGFFLLFPRCRNLWPNCTVSSECSGRRNRFRI